jgi:hypothetical protein
MEFTLDRTWCRGLGTELMVLSTLLDYRVTQLNISADLNNKNFEIYKKVFRISDDQLYINHTRDLKNEIYPSDLFKIYSPYYKLPNTKTNKKYIGIASYQDSIASNNPGLFDYPDCKYYSIDNYSLLYKQLKNFGWEVITLDSKLVPLEEKVYLISNFCECVIGYEGGMAHLCHMLDIPYIMFPWKIPFDAKLLHLDKKTYFLDSFDQILSWNKQDLNKCINNLHNEISNNELIGNMSAIKELASQHPVSCEEQHFLAYK